MEAWLHVIALNIHLTGENYQGKGSDVNTLNVYFVPCTFL